MTRKSSLGILVGLQLAASWATAQAAPTAITWYGQSAFRLVTPNGHVVLFDPWIANPFNKSGAQDLAAIEKADLILISHGHFDHVGQATAIAKKTKAKLVASYELGGALVRWGGFPKEQAGYDSLGNVGGTLTFFDGEVRITLVPAVHGSSVNAKELGAGTEETDQFAGNPGGFVVQIKNGPTLYHTGDTDVFGDMAELGRLHKIDYMLVCIGDHFTMGPEGAAEAVRLVGPAKAIPMHYGTFMPMMTGTPEQFAVALRARKLGSKLQELEVGKPTVLTAVTP
jgi:L-ascorbate metabolism protein UlaG (beta-lactamase superfamily)